MSLSDRKKKILSCVVESYIVDGEAVGSKTLQAALDFEVSSATTIACYHSTLRIITYIF